MRPTLTLVLLLGSTVALFAQATCQVGFSSFDICTFCPDNITDEGVITGDFVFDLPRNSDFVFPFTCGSGEEQLELSLGDANFTIVVNNNTTVVIPDGFLIDPSAQDFTVQPSAGRSNARFVFMGETFNRNQLMQEATEAVRDAGAAAPIELLSWTATAHASTVLLQWSSATEVDNDFYAIEYSADGAAFAELVRVPGSSASEATLHYDYTHAAPGPGTHYYRLAQQDLDGTRTTFDVLSLSVEGPSAALAPFPNPAVAGGTITVAPSSTRELSLLRTDGSLVRRYPASDRPLRITLPADLPAGVYLIRSGERVSRLLVR